MEKKEYFIEDFEADIDWFEGIGVNNERAKSYILYVLARGMSEELRLKLLEEKI